MTDRLQVIFEDNHLLVLDKPPLLPTMGVGEDQDSLLRQAKAYLRKKYHKPGNVYLGVVSRIDAFVSGVVVFARTSKAASRLTDQFRRRSVDKVYLAILPDVRTLPDKGCLEHWLVKNESQHRMVALDSESTQPPGGKRAILHYRTLGRCHGERLVEITLETGRKHQIRVQFSAVGCPLVGDRKYDSERPFPRGIALHSCQLSFDHPTQKTRQSFQSLPPSFWRINRFGYDRKVD